MKILELSQGNAKGLGNIIARMDDGIRIMNAQKGAGQNTFVLGMTGAGKSTITLLLTAKSDLFSCKRSDTDINYVIRDVQQVISTKDTESKTKVPEILHDPRLGTTFYDCPGFSDTNSTDELTNAYFIKHALDSSKKAKFILVAPQHTLETAGSRHYFSRLLLHTVKTIKNVEKYVESFALAVTFANPSFSQERLVKNVAGYLKVLLDEELDKKFQGQGEILRRVKALVMSLLGQDENEKFIAIGVFRRPTRHGSLSTIESAHEDRQQLLRMLTEGTEYTETDPQDFGYSVSDGGKLQAEALGSLIDQTVRQNMDQFWAQLQRHYERELYRLKDPIEHKSSMDDTLRVLTSVRQFFNGRHGGNTTWTEGPKEFVANLMSSMASLRLGLPNNPILSSLLLQQSHTNFVEKLLGESASKLQSANWLNGLESLTKFLEVYTSWIQSLIRLEESLGAYQIQKAGYTFPQFRNQSGSMDLTAENVHAVTSSKTVPQALRPIKATLSPFARVNGNNGKAVINFRQLNPILEYFSSAVSCTSHGTVSTVKGNFILASRLIANDDNCITAATQKVVIYAWDTFFLDAPFHAKSITGKDTFDLVIIAKTLESTGHQRIVLSGRDAASPENPVAAKGRDGAEGSVGMRGGDFFGLFGKIDGQVSVESNGGKGGDGQGGGDGLDGWNGTIFDKNTLKRITFKPAIFEEWQNYPSGCLVTYVPPGITYKVHYGEDYPCIPRFTATQNDYQYEYHGTSGQPGGKGGNGGAAGQGGQPGVGKMYEISGHNLRSTTINGKCGPAGLPGAGGKGGSGGLSSKGTSCINNDHEVGGVCTLNLVSTWELRASDGPFGKKGGRHPRCQSVKFRPHTSTSDMITYKAAARAQLKSSTANRRLLPFLLELEENQGVSRELFTAKSFIADLIALENQFPSLLKQSDLQLNLLYDAVFKRTTEMLSSSHSEEESSILRHAASAAYGRLAMLSKKNKTSQSSNHIITDLEGYINLTDQILQNLQTLESGSNAAKQIGATKEKFLEFIQSRIKEVDELTEQVIQPEISKIQDYLTKGMDAILKQLIEERQKAITARNELYTQQLKDTVLLSKIFGFLKIGAQALSFLGPLGAAAGAVISTGASVAQSFTGGTNTGPSSASLASELQNKALSWHFEAQKEKLQDKEFQLRDLQGKYEGSLEADRVMWNQKFQKNKERIGLALNRVADLTKRVKDVQDLRPSPVTSQVVELIEKNITYVKAQVKSQLEAMETSLKNEVERSDQDQMRATKFLGTTQRLLSVVNTGAELYKLFKQDDSKLDELAKAENVLQGYHSKIQTAGYRMPQILNQLEKITTEAFKSARNQSLSGAALDVSGWQLQSTLDDVTAEIESKILAGAPIDSQVKAGMVRLKEAFRTLFKICDRIQDLVTEQRMATFISDSLVAAAEAAPMQQDPELFRNLRQLKLVSQSNLVLHYGQNIESSFGMYVFPYADIYLSQISLLQGEQDLLRLPQNATDLPTLVTEISRRTDALKTKLATFRTTIVPELHTSQRVGGFSLGNPLYTWTAEEVKTMLPDLLTGRPINLIADVRKSPASFDAVKFNRIHLHFISNGNATINSALQSELRSFGLNMTHGGANYYRFDGKHYRVYSEPLSLQVCYDLGPNQHKNLNYVKLGQGPPLLSPYSLWTFQLYRNSRRVTFDGLRKFLGQEIALVLTGYGTYVTNSAGQSATRQVDRFYKAVQI